MSLSYWLNAHLCWVMLGLLYFLLLRSTTFYRWNRWYLLGSSLLGLIIPVWSAWMIDDNNFVNTYGWLPEVLVSIELGLYTWYPFYCYLWCTSLLIVAQHSYIWP